MSDLISNSVYKPAMHRTWWMRAYNEQQKNNYLEKTGGEVGNDKLSLSPQALREMDTIVAKKKDEL